MDFATLAKLRRHLSVKHHVPGRIRIKYNPSIITDPAALKLIKDPPEMPPGIQSARHNAMAQSVVIEYQAKHIPSEMVEEMITTGSDARAEELMHELDSIVRAI